ncbi:MAG TPA: AsmA-like C-terminal region-containing protein, partial [Gammaproteobacteria bacterium]
AGHSAALQWEARGGVQRLARGELKFGAGDAQLPEGDGLRVTGRLDSFDWAAWRPLQSTRPPGELLKELDVRIDELHAFARVFRTLRIHAQRQADQWSVQLSGPDIEGTVDLPKAEGQPLRLRFAQLTIPPSDAGPNGEPMNPATLPALDMEVQKLRYRDLDMGQVTLLTHPLATGMAVDKLQVNADWSRLAIQGEWTQPAPEQDVSQFRIDVQSGELGKLLTTFGHAGSVEGGAIKAGIDARWTGTPADFALSRLEGSLDMHIGKGRLLNVEAGAGRMFGLFSLHGLRRRLSLDFSDVFAKGFAFDRIDGRFDLRDGDAHTRNLVIEGPAARIQISGRTGLTRHDYDQLVTVIPRVQSGLPIAGAIAGGPVVGAALLLADQLFSAQIEELTSFTQYTYKVTGSWDDPQYTPVQRDSARGLQEENRKVDQKAGPRVDPSPEPGSDPGAEPGAKQEEPQPATPGPSETAPPRNEQPAKGNE